MDYIGSDVIYQKLKNVLGSQPMDSTEMFYIVKRLEADVLQNRLTDIQNMIIKNTVESEKSKSNEEQKKFDDEMEQPYAAQSTPKVLEPDKVVSINKVSKDELLQHIKESNADYGVDKDGNKVPISDVIKQIEEATDESQS